MASMNDKDYYAILGVSKDASTEEIRKAFQQKARKLHPDVNKEPDAEERFKEVSEAYAVLSDDEKRRRYDAMRSGAPFAGGYSGQAPRGGYGDPFAGGPYAWGPFGASTRRQSRAYRPRQGADVVIDVTVGADKAASGMRRGVTYQRYAACDHCHGTGSVEAEHSETCPTCGGRGRISVDLGSIFGIGVMEMECPECEGTGRVVADPCDVCGGTGRTLTASEVVVDIPAGSHDGDEVRVPGMGNAGTNGEAAGDFVCRVCVPEERLTPSQANGFALRGLWPDHGLAWVLLAVYRRACGGRPGHGCARRRQAEPPLVEKRGHGAGQRREPGLHHRVVRHADVLVHGRARKGRVHGTWLLAARRAAS